MFKTISKTPAVRWYSPERDGIPHRDLAVNLIFSDADEPEGGQLGPFVGYWQPDEVLTFDEDLNFEEDIQPKWYFSLTPTPVPDSWVVDLWCPFPERSPTQLTNDVDARKTNSSDMISGMSLPGSYEVLKEREHSDLIPFPDRP